MKRDIDQIIETLPYLVKPGYCDHSRSIATHEASHAMIIILNGYTPERVSIDPPITIFGWDGLHADFTASLHMAGAVGQAVQSGSYVFSDQDRINLYDVIKRAGLEYPDIEMIWKKTHVELINHWQWVQLIASNLLREGTLYDEYFKRLLHEAEN